MTRTLILPGLHNSDSDHWQSRWEARDWSLRRVIQDDWETPRCGDWVTRLDQALALTGPDAALVAHSAGCALVVHWAIAHPGRHIRGALLVAPSDPEALSFPFGPTGFAPMPLRRLPFRSVVVASSNDPYLTLSRAKTFATAWGSDFVMIGQAGHIGSASRLGDWPEGFSLLRSLHENSRRRFPWKTGEVAGCSQELAEARKRTNAPA